MTVRARISAADALIAIDVQNDFCPGGALAVPAGDEVVGPVNRLAPCFSHVAFTQDWHPPGHGSFASAHPGRTPYERISAPYGLQELWPDHCVIGSRGADFHPALDLSRASMILRKGVDPDVDSYSAFRENDRRTSTGLAGWLRERGVRRVFLCGLAFDFCVAWSAEDARSLGFETVVVEDACRALDMNRSAAASRRRMTAAGVRFMTSAERFADVTL